MQNVFMIGIAGGSGSGKSTFTQRLQNLFGDQVAFLSCDNYYRAHDELPFESRRKLNYDEPNAIEFELLAQQIQELKQGKDIQCPVYDFSLHTRSDKVIEIASKPVVILEGILIFSQAELRDLMDLKIYIETDADERILRRARRDIGERGRQLDDVIEQYLSTVKPMHNQYVEPTKTYADVILNGGLNQNAFEIIKNRIEKILSGVEK